MSLSNLADILGALGRTEEARKALDEAAELAARDGHTLALPTIGPFSFSYELRHSRRTNLRPVMACWTGFASVRNIDIACYTTQNPGGVTELVDGEFVLTQAATRLGCLRRLLAIPSCAVGWCGRLRAVGYPAQQAEDAVVGLFAPEKYDGDHDNSSNWRDSGVGDRRDGQDGRVDVSCCCLAAEYDDADSGPPPGCCS